MTGLDALRLDYASWDRSGAGPEQRAATAERLAGVRGRGARVDR